MPPTQRRTESVGPLLFLFGLVREEPSDSQPGPAHFNSVVGYPSKAIVSQPAYYYEGRRYVQYYITSSVKTQTLDPFTTVVFSSNPPPIPYVL